MSTSSSATWYLAHQGQQTGPFSWPDLQSQAAGGRVAADDLVWCDGMADWVAASTLPGLLPSGRFSPAGPLDYNRPTLEYAPPTDMPYAGFWRRFGAVFIDGIIMRIVGFIIGFVIGFVIAGAKGGQASQQTLEVIQLVAGGVGIVISWLYETLMIASYRKATLGKMAMGIEVIGPDGGQLTFGRATGRYFGKFLSGIILCIGYLMMLWSDRKQTLHDLMATTFVVRVR